MQALCSSQHLHHVSMRSMSGPRLHSPHSLLSFFDVSNNLGNMLKANAWVVNQTMGGGGSRAVLTDMGKLQGLATEQRG
jgi:hypothetical protein